MRFFRPAYTVLAILALFAVIPSSSNAEPIIGQTSVIDGDTIEIPRVGEVVIDACKIKGNVNRGGERIFHVPGGQYYRSIKIDTSKGERWFCSEADARKAGWRKSRR